MHSPRGLGKLQRFSYFHNKTHTVAETEVHLFIVLVYPTGWNLHILAVENMNGFD